MRFAAPWISQIPLSISRVNQNIASQHSPISSSSASLFRSRAISFAVVVLIVTFSGCKDLGEQPQTLDIVNAAGTVVQQSPTFYVIRCDFPFQISTQTFYPTNLPDAFRKDGLRVRFSGKIDSSPWIDYLYLPIKLTTIERLQS
jgi:hypothetical protein